MLDDLGIAHGLDAAQEHIERHPGHLGGMVLLRDFVVAVIIGRAEQLAGVAALVDDLETALRGLGFDLLRGEELVEVMAEDVIDRILLGLERQTVGRRDIERLLLRGSSALALALDDHHESVVFADHRLGDVEQLERAAGGPDRLRQRGETDVLGIEGDVEVRADVGRRRTAELSAATTATGTTFAPAAAVKTVARASGATGTARTAVASWGTFSAGVASGRGAGRALEGAAVLAIGPRPTGAGPVLAAGPRVIGTGFVFAPLGTKAEGLQLAQIKLIEAFGGSVVGWLFVHEKTGAGPCYAVVGVGCRRVE